MNKFILYALVVLLLAIFTVLAVTSIWPDRKSPTCDELAHHIPVGYILLSKWDFDMDPSQPPLPRYIAALPLKIFMEVNVPSEKKEWRREDRTEFGRDFFYKYNRDPHKMIFLSRLAFVLVGILCGIILFVTAKAFYGAHAALFSLFLYSFSPNMIAHTSLAAVDMTASCFMLLALYSFWMFLKKNSFKCIAFAGISLGLAQLSKYTSVILYPLFVVFLLFEFRGKSAPERLKLFFHLFIIFVTSFIVLWAGYGFDSKPILYDAMRVEEKIAIAHHIVGNMIPFWHEEWFSALDSFLLKTPFPLGTHVLGILGVIRHGFEGHSTYFLGSWSNSGNPLYFAVAFLIKTPIPSIIFIITGIFLSFAKGMKREERLLLISIAVIFITSSLSKLQLGLRYILPMYPLCFILAGKCATLWQNKALKGLIIMLMAWYILSSVRIWPDYLSYFSEIIGGPKNGYKYLRDSNIDWGQDLPQLARYLKEKNVERVRLLYFGTADPASYGITYDVLDETERIKPRGEIYAISVHKLDEVRWTKDYEPVARIGYSIYVYDFQSD